MIAANRVHVEQGIDHFIVRFGFSKSGDLNDAGDEVAVVMLPLTTGASAALDLFAGIYKSAPAITEFFGTLQTRVNEINSLKTATSDAAAAPIADGTGEKK